MLRQVLSRRLARQCTQRRTFQHIADPSAASPVQPRTTPLYTPPERSDEPDFELPKTLHGLPTEADIKRQLKQDLSLKAIEGMPEYEEEDLREFYKNLVLSGAEEAPNQLPQIEGPSGMPYEQRVKLIGELASRLVAPKDDSTFALIPALDNSLPRHIALTSALIALAPEQPRGPTAIGLGVATQSEWQALFDSFVSGHERLADIQVHTKDAAGAEVLLSTMERHGVLPNTSHIDKVLDLYAQRGQTGEVARLISDLESVGVAITDKHRDLIISSYITAVHPDTDGAMALLTSAEELGRPFPQSSYNIVLSHLTEATPTYQPDSRSRALAWDLFASMRFAAHPVPTREVYTTMIKACSTPHDPQPERARDLWLEMTSTEGNSMEPIREQYDALIRALGSTKFDYLEAYDLLRQMLAKHQEATMVPFEDRASQVLSPWVPTLETFTALLEGTKRAGDLERARWVLGEAVDLARTAAFAGHRLEGPDEELLAALFQTYAAWKPTRDRKDIGVKAGSGAPDGAEAGTEATGTEVAEAAEPEPFAAPQTSAEAIREAEALWVRVLQDVAAANAGKGNIMEYPFAGVKITPRLVNSYLSLHLAHAPVEDARTTSEATWEQVKKIARNPANAPKPNGWTYLAILNRCTHTRKQAGQRDVATKWGEETWPIYLNYLDTMTSTIAAENKPEKVSARRRWLAGIGERQVEKAWAFAISLAAKSDTSLALKRLDDFVMRYPPANILEGYAPQMNKLKVRMMEPSSISEANVPPHLLFTDLKALHQRCVIEDNWDGVAKVKWVGTTYAHWLGRRRRWRLQGVGVPRELRSDRRRREVLEGGERLERLE